MQYVLIVHAVKEYPKWKQVFDSAADIRKQAGEERYELLADDTNANNIVHFSKWATLEKARAFFESPQLVEIRKKAGVEAPTFLYLNQIEAGTL